MTGTIAMMIGTISKEVKTTGLIILTIMTVVTKLRGGNVATGSSVGVASPAASTTATVAEGEAAAAVTDPTSRTTGPSTATTTAREATITTRTATTRTAKEAVTEDGAVRTEPDLTVVAWTEEAPEVLREGTPEAAVAVHTEVARPEAREFLVEVLGLSSSASEHTRHDRPTQ